MQAAYSYGFKVVIGYASAVTRPVGDVVEVAFDGVQHSPRNPAAMALRFARVLHHRPDKRADDADTVDQVHQIHQPG